jgi:hypothetical protein
MPELLQLVMLISPTTHFVAFVQSLVFRGAGLDLIWPPLAATLGPIAAMSLLLGLHKGYSEFKGTSERSMENKALRKKIREEESKKTPYFKLRPYVKGEAPPPRRQPDEAGLLTTYTDADNAEAA